MRPCSVSFVLGGVGSVLASVAFVALGAGNESARPGYITVSQEPTENPANPTLSDWRFDAIGAIGRTVVFQEGNPVEIRGTCTLISPTQVLFARHSVEGLPENPLTNPGGFMVRFRRKLDGSLGGPGVGWYQVALTRITLSGADGAEVSDWGLGELPVPIKHIQPIPVQFSDPPIGAPLIIAGWGMTTCDTSAWSTTPKSLHFAPTTLNRYVENLLYFVPFGASCAQYNEPFGIRGDSGGPVLITVGGGLRTVGIILYTTSGVVVTRLDVPYPNPIPGWCPADLNLDGLLDAKDSAKIEELLAAGNWQANFSRDGVLDADDRAAFQAPLQAPCP